MTSTDPLICRLVYSRRHSCPTASTMRVTSGQYSGIAASSASSCVRVTLSPASQQDSSVYCSSSSMLRPPVISYCTGLLYEPFPPFIPGCRRASAEPHAADGATSKPRSSQQLPPILQADDPTGDQQERHQKHQHAHRKDGGNEDTQSQPQCTDAQKSPAAVSGAPCDVPPSFPFRFYGSICRGGAGVTAAAHKRRAEARPPPSLSVLYLCCQSCKGLSSSYSRT